MIKTICHFKDSFGPVAIKTDRIVSIEGNVSGDGTMYTRIIVSGIASEDALEGYSVTDSVTEAISEWERQLRAQNS